MGALAVADDFLDLVYEAAIDETRWRDVLDRLCDSLGGDMAVLRKIDSADLNGTKDNRPRRFGDD